MNKCVSFLDSPLSRAVIKFWYSFNIYKISDHMPYKVNFPQNTWIN